MRNVVPTPSKPKTKINYAQQFPSLPSYVAEPEEMRQQKRIEVIQEEKIQLDPKLVVEEEEEDEGVKVAEEQKAAERSSEQATVDDDAQKPEDKRKLADHNNSSSNNEKTQPRVRSSRHRHKVIIGGMPVIPPAPPSQAASRRTKLSVAQQSILDESGKLLNVLRKEVSKLRDQNSQLRLENETLKVTNQRLQDANSTAGNQFSLLNQHAKSLNETTSKQAEDLTKCRQQIQQLSIGNVELKEELKMKQATYVAEVQSRLHQQKMLSKVIDKLQEKCRDARLVEEILTLLDDGESEYLGVAAPSSTPQPTNVDHDAEPQQS